MEIHQLRYFVAVAEVGSFSRAAIQCGVAQPSLSQQIKRLEISLGVRLFDRFGRSIALTEAGESLLPRAKRILAEVNEAAGELLTSGSEGVLRVGAIPTMAPYLLPRVLEAFSKKHPDCRLTVREDLTARLVDALIDCELDCAITSTPIDNELIEAERIASESLLVALPRDFDVPARGKIRLRDLEDQPAVVLHEIHCLGRQIQDFCAARRLKQRIVCRSTQLATVLELVALGLGVSIVPEMCARGDRSSRRRYMPLVDPVPTRDVAIAWRVGRTRPTVARVFADDVREYIGRK